MPKSHDKNENRNISKAKLKSRRKKGKMLKTYTISGGIDVSKQLTSKLYKSKVAKFRSNRPAIINNEPRICGNGKPMPSLAELEKMYEDSDDGEEQVPNCQVKEQFKTTEQNLPLISKDKVISPKTIQTIASKMMDYVQNLSDCITIDDEYNPQPVVPQKKRKKSGIPYIVGCKERNQVQWNPKTKFGVGDTKYGVDQNILSDIEDNPFDEPMPTVNICRSKFNAMSEEIAGELKVAEKKSELINRFLFNENKENEENLDVINIVEHPENYNDSSDSSKTICYDCPKSIQQRSFSPLPSTSSDYKTFLQNDKRFHESLNCNSSISINNESHVSDDTNDCIKMKYEEPEQDIKLDNVQNEVKNDSPIDVDKYYSSVKLDFTIDKSNCDEIIDVDATFASNKVLLDKYNNNMNTSDVIVINTDTENNCNLKKHRKQTENRKMLNNKNIPITITNENQMSECSIINISDVSSVNNTINLSESVPIVASTVENVEIDLTKFPFANQPQPNIEYTQTLSSLSPISRWTTLGKNTQSNPRKRRKQTNYSKNTSTPVRDPPNTCLENTTLTARNIDCPICMENVFTKQAASTLCGHIFCLPCIQKSIKSFGKKCPSCRKVLRGTGYHQLFL